MSLRSDNLDSVGEFYTEDDFRQLVVAIEATPAFLGGLGDLEDHGERSLVRKTSIALDHWRIDRRRIRFAHGRKRLPRRGRIGLSRWIVLRQSMAGEAPQGWKAPKPYIRIVPQPKA